jgi:hypothetical protein
MSAFRNGVVAIPCAGMAVSEEVCAMLAAVRWLRQAVCAKVAGLVEGRAEGSGGEGQWP